MGDTIIKVDGVGKKFCKTLRHTMRYGASDLARSFLGLPQPTGELRQGEFWALKEVGFELKRGECLGLIGANGAGKSTLLKILNGIMAPDKGKVEISGRVGALIEVGAGFHPMLTGRENIYVNGAILGFSKRQIDEKFDDIVAFSELNEFIDTPVKHYSSGMYVRLGFAIAAQMEPDLLLIDEVLAVGDLAFRAKCFNALQRVMEKSAVVFVSHSMPDVTRISQKLLVLGSGEPLYRGGDLGAGLQAFHEACGQSRGVEGTIVTGNGTARICQIDLLGDGIVIEDSLHHQCRFGVRFLVKIDHEIETPCFNVSVLNQELCFVAQANSYFCSETVVNDGQWQWIEVDFGQINLNPGNYSLEITVHAEKLGEVLHKQHNCRPFRVLGNFCGVAPIQVDAGWRTSPQNTYPVRDQP